MKILILHLSDVHFGKGNNPVSKRTRAIAAATMAAASGEGPIAAAFVVATGDIAFSGRADEYAQAELFFANLRKELAERVVAAAWWTLCIPGNHDCDFTVDADLRNALVAKLRASEARAWDSDATTLLWAPQGAYEKCALGLMGATTVEWGVTPFIGRCRFTVEGRDLIFRLINTAVLSMLHESPGSLRIPSDALREIRSTADENAALVLTLMHHPYNWFAPPLNRDVRAAVEQTSDLVLTGHEHDPDSYNKVRPGEVIEYIEGAALQTDGDPEKSAFHALLLDLDDSTQVLHTFEWASDKGLYSEVGANDPRPFAPNGRRKRNQFTLLPKFLEYLDDPGVALSHPLQDVKLDDVFVFPHLRVLQLLRMEAAEVSIVQDDIAGFALDTGKVLIQAPEKGGRTSLAKSLFREFYSRGYVPVLIHGGDVRRPAAAEVVQVTKRAYLQQYGSPSAEAFLQTAKAKKVLLVDDVGAIRANAKGRNVILAAFAEEADCVVLFGGSWSEFLSVVDDGEAEQQLWDYAICDIMPLGREKRHELVKKWVYLGRDLTDGEESLYRSMVEIEKTVDEVIGKNYMPSYPLFVLLIVQSLQVRAPLTLNAASGSHGYLYEALLTTTLARASNLQLDLETQYNYLAEFAMKLRVAGAKRMSKRSLAEWHRQYCERYQLQLELDEMLAALQGANVLHLDTDEWGFRYPYVYYYFIGRYLRDHLGEDSTRDEIRLLSKKLHQEEAANILLFLSYLSRDAIVIESILESAIELFAGSPECDVVADTGFVNELGAEIPRLVLDEQSAEARRRDLLRKADARDARMPSKTQEAQDLAGEGVHADGDEQLSEVLQTNRAFKAIQIMGQLLRNYRGSLQGVEKQRIGQETYSLGLRVLGYGMHAIEAVHSEYVQYLARELTERFPDWSTPKIQKKIGDWMFAFAEGMALVVIRHLADSLGHEELRLTFETLEAANPNPSYQMVGLDIRLRYFRQFPEREVFGAYEGAAKSAFAADVVRQLVWRHLTVFPARDDLIQRVCKKLDIDRPRALLLDPRTKITGPGP